ncbi:MAG TPA: HAMP domain-containing protein [Anaerolineales bacterium]|nr:HAMP domain-containing protein [Anaerolineales bacterium]
MQAAHDLFTFLNRSLRAKITIGVVLPLVIILGVFTAIENERRREAVLSNLSFLASQIGQVIEDGIQHEMLSQNREGLQHMLDAIGQNEIMQIVYLLDTDGRVVFSPQRRDLGRQLDNRDPTCQPCHALPVEQRPGSVVVTLPDGQRVFRSMQPIENQPVCQECHDSDDRLIGILLTDISMAPLEAPLAAELRESVLWSVGVILVALIVVNIAMSRFIVRRLEGVARALARFGRGQIDQPLPADSPDEIGQLAIAFNDMSQRIQNEEAENRALSEGLRRESGQRYELLKRLITAQEEERRRVARDLHDELGQGLGGLAFSLEAIERLWIDSPEVAREQLRQTRALVAETTNLAYDLILALRPSALDDLGLVPALRAHAERALKDTGIQLQIESRDLTRRLPPEIEIALFRTFQEALTNIVRHAGASRVCVSLAARDGAFEGEIADDGRGFDLREARSNGDGPRGLGLLGMQERVAQCGGQLQIFTEPGTGTRIQIYIPIPEVTCG